MPKTGVGDENSTAIELDYTDQGAGAPVVLIHGKKLQVSEAQRQYAVSLALPASPKGTLDCITAFGRTDVRTDIAKVTVPTLVIHGDGDDVVPFEVSGQRSAQLVPGARLHVVKDGQHGINASHPEEFNRALVGS